MQKYVTGWRQWTLAFLFWLPFQASASDLIITGIIDGPLTGGTPKALELYAVNAIADLSIYGVGSATNGNPSSGVDFTLSGSAAAGEFLYVASESTQFTNFFGFAPTFTNSVMNINGDDAIELFQNGAVVDVYGVVGVDGTGESWDHLDGWAYRNDDTTATTSFVPADWTFSGTNALDGATSNATAESPFPIGTYMTGGTPTPPGNEVSLVDATDNNIVEADPNAAGGEITDITVDLADEGGETQALLKFNNLSIPAGSTLVAAELRLFTNSTTSGTVSAFRMLQAWDDDSTWNSFGGNGVQNDGTEAVPTASFTIPEPADDTLLTIDVTSDVAFWLANASANQGWVFTTDSTDGWDFNSSEAEDNPPQLILTFITKIHAIQGTTDQNLLDDQVVTIEAIVVGDFQDGDTDDSRNLRGFYVQEEDADADGSAATSEGIFIFEGGNTNTDVNVGDLVQVTGTVDEYFGETQIDSVTNITVVSSNNPLPTAATIDLPAAAVSTAQDGDYQPDLEAFEGMLVTFADTLTITEMFQLDRFNEIKLVEGNRPQQFTQNNAPDPAGFDAYLQALGARTITYDDGLNQQNALIGNLDGFGPTFNTASDIRMGDTISNLTGVLSYQWAGNSSSQATWRVRSAVDGTNQVTKVNNRPVTPDAVGGTLKVVSLNVLNYFTTIDNGSNTTDTGLEPRGVDNQDEFDRQTEKLITTLRALDADVLGLVEVENSSSNAALANIVDELNAVLGAGTYDYVATGLIGGDAIAVGFIYKTSTVSLKGNFAILDSTVDATFVDSKNRPALAQTFTEISSGESFTAVINHLKSKGSSCQDIGDADGTGGEGNCNGTRTAAAQALANWLATDPTDSNDPDFLILGDLNAYAAETPITTLEAAGYTDLARQFVGADAYSYVFDGQLGTLDYALANASLLSQVSGATEWHVNADEADAIDYNLDFGRDQSIFDGSVAYRNSDHDPVIVGLNLRTPQSLPVTVINDGNSKNSLRNVIAAAGAGDTIDLTQLRGTLNLKSPLEISKDLTLQGPDALTFGISGRNKNALFVVKGGATLTLNDLLLYRGNAGTTDNGGALQVIENSNVVLNRVRLQGNQAANGAAIFIEAGSSVRLINSLVAGNYATTSGAGIYNVGTLAVINSHIVFNRADGQGGGIFNGGGLMEESRLLDTVEEPQYNGSLTLINSLIWNNTDVSGRSSSTNSAASVQEQQAITSRVNSLVQGLAATDGNLDGLFNAVNYPQLIQMGNSEKARLPSLGGDFRSETSSVLIDNGDDANYDPNRYGIFDLFGKVRINGSAINIGAFEE